MSEKVVLPKEVAEAIDKALQFIKYHENVIKHKYLTNWLQLKFDFENKSDLATFYILDEYAKDHPIEYMTALVNGYTVEQTKEERLLALYERLDADDRYEALELDGIRMALEILEITIPGINDKEEA